MLMPYIRYQCDVLVEQLALLVLGEPAAEPFGGDQNVPMKKVACAQ